MRQRRVYLASETPFFLDPLSGLGLLLFCLEPQKLFLFSSFLVVAIKNVLDLSMISIDNSVRDKINVQRLNSQGGTHPITPAGLPLDILYLPLFSVNLAPYFILGLAVPGWSAPLVVIDDVIQGVLEFIEARKHGHGGIEIDITEGWRRG